MITSDSKRYLQALPLRRVLISSPLALLIVPTRLLSEYWTGVEMRNRACDFESSHAALEPGSWCGTMALPIDILFRRLHETAAAVDGLMPSIARSTVGTERIGNRYIGPHV